MHWYSASFSRSFRLAVLVPNSLAESFKYQDFSPPVTYRPSKHPVLVSEPMSDSKSTYVLYADKVRSSDLRRIILVPAAYGSHSTCLLNGKGQCILFASSLASFRSCSLTHELVRLDEMHRAVAAYIGPSVSFGPLGSPRKILEIGYRPTSLSCRSHLMPFFFSQCRIWRMVSWVLTPPARQRSDQFRIQVHPSCSGVS